MNKMNHTIRPVHTYTPSIILIQTVSKYSTHSDRATFSNLQWSAFSNAEIGRSRILWCQECPDIKCSPDNRLCPSWQVRPNTFSTKGCLKSNNQNKTQLIWYDADISCYKNTIFASCNIGKVQTSNVDDLLIFYNIVWNFS